MSGIREKLDEAIRETLKDPEGAGSDLTVIDEYDNWIFLDGSLDVEHLVSEIIETLGLKYEYATRLVPDPERPELIFQSSWKSYARAVDDLVDDGKTSLIRRIAPGEEEVIEYTGPRNTRT